MNVKLPTGKLVSAATGERMGELMVPFRVTHQNLVNTLANAFESRRAGIDGLPPIPVNRNLTADDVFKVINIELARNGSHSFQVRHTMPETTLDWARLQIDKIWG